MLKVSQMQMWGLLPTIVMQLKLFQILAIVCLASFSTAVPIIIKDISPSPPLAINYTPNYGLHLKPVSQLHTLAIPKVYLAPSVLKAPVTLATPVLSKSIILPTVPPIVVKDPEPYNPNPGYSYSYAVNDPSTGDNKAAEETLENGVVRGSYSLSEPDGTIRKVTYRADDVNGFQATVEKIGQAQYHHILSPLIKKYLGSSLPISSIRHSIKPVPPYRARPVYHTLPTASILPALVTRHFQHNR